MQPSLPPLYPSKKPPALPPPPPQETCGWLPPYRIDPSIIASSSPPPSSSSAPYQYRPQPTQPTEPPPPTSTHTYYLHKRAPFHQHPPTIGMDRSSQDPPPPSSCGFLLHSGREEKLPPSRSPIRPLSFFPPSYFHAVMIRPLSSPPSASLLRPLATRKLCSPLALIISRIFGGGGGGVCVACFCFRCCSLPLSFLLPYLTRKRAPPLPPLSLEPEEERGGGGRLSPSSRY